MARATDVHIVQTRSTSKQSPSYVRWLDILFYWLASAFLATSLTSLWSAVLFKEQVQNVFQPIILTVTLAFALVLSPKKKKYLYFLVFLLLTLACYWFGPNWFQLPWQVFFKSLTAISKGQFVLSDPAKVVLFTCISSLLTSCLTWVKPCPLTLTSLFLLPFLFWPKHSHLSLVECALTLACLAVVFARYSSFRFKWRESRQFSPLILITGLILCSYLLQTILPADFFRNQALSDWLDQEIKSRKKMPDTVDYYEFSIRDAGFYPLADRLGGKVVPSKEDFLEVRGPSQSFYLRGAVYGGFTGQGWLPSEMQPNYMFYNDRPIDEQKKAFDYPGYAENNLDHVEKFFRKGTIQIGLIHLPSQVIFHAGKPVSILSQEKLEEDDLAGMYFFNPDGQLYAADQLKSPGYQVSGFLSKSPGDSGADQQLLDLLSAGTAALDQAATGQSQYKNALEQYDPQLADLVYRPVDNDRDLLAKLLAVRDYLQFHYQYSLDVVNPPEGEDFFLHFLQTKKGYCTYFATALSLLGQEMGLPTRYVEGFVVQGLDADSGADYQRKVTGDQAHAWTELYIRGIGWYNLDATPADVQANLQHDKEKQDTPPSKPTSPPTRPKPTVSKKPSQNQAPKTHKTEKTTVTKLILLALIVLALTLVLIKLLHSRMLLNKRHRPEDMRRGLAKNPAATLLSIWQDLKYLYALLEPGQDTRSWTVLQWVTALKVKLNLSVDDSYAIFNLLDPLLYGPDQASINLENIDTFCRVYQLAEDQVKADLSFTSWTFKRLFKLKPLLSGNNEEALG